MNCYSFFFTVLFSLNCFLLQGAHAQISAGVKPAPPFSIKNENGQWKGISYELWERVSEKTGIKAQYVEVGLEDGLSKLKNNNLDLLIGAYSLTPERELQMDFSHPFYSSGYGLAVVGEENNYILGLLMSFFSWEFFIAVGVLILILFFTGSLMWAFERKHNPEQFRGETKRGLWDGFWWSAVTMTTVGYGDKAPISFFGKIFGLIWMFASIILISGLTGSIAASLAVKQLSSNISGLEDLRSKTTGVLEGSSAQAYLAKEGYSRLRHFKSIQEGLESLKKNDIQGFFHDKPLLSYRLKEGGEVYQSLVVLPKNYGDEKYAFVIPQDSKLREKINGALLEILKSNEWQTILSKYGAEP